MGAGDRWGPDGPPEDAYERVTDAERFRPLHDAARNALARLRRVFDVAVEEGLGLDAEIEGSNTLASMRLTPRNAGAAPLTVVFTDFPGLMIRYGRWHTTALPVCGCDACDETAEANIAILEEDFSALTEGRFRESITTRLGDPWLEYEWLLPGGERRGGGGGRLTHEHAQQLRSAGAPDTITWRPWASAPAGS